MFLFFFFFKQKTAYEMRISDWSSDVCSSDLPRHMEDLRLERRQTRARRRFAAEIADETGELHVISHRRAPDGDLDRKDRAVGAARHPVLRPHLRETDRKSVV